LERKNAVLGAIPTVPSNPEQHILTPLRSIVSKPDFRLQPAAAFAIPVLTDQVPPGSGCPVCNLLPLRAKLYNHFFHVHEVVLSALMPPAILKSENITSLPSSAVQN
jgi:hypothetical protein